MKSLVFFFAIVLGVQVSVDLKAQGYIQDISGSPITERNISDLGGSPYFNDQFLKGSIVMDDKSIFTDLYLRYDQEADQLVYRKANSSASMVTTGKVVEFKIDLPNSSPATFRSIIKNDPNVDGFYQVIADGTVSLLKKTKRKVVERVEYNSTTKSKSMVTQTNYFILKADGNLVQVKADKKAIVKALGRNEAQLTDYINKEGINFKSDSDLRKLIDYSNSLG
jgi:hypothetical protein